MKNKTFAKFLVTLVVTVVALGYTFAAGNAPLLGLDLQGGVSVVLQPTEHASAEQLNQAVEIMRRRVDAIGVAEPEVAAQGDSIIVSLPGVDDPQRALELVGRTAELRFRPVLDIVEPGTPITPPEEASPDDTVVFPSEDNPDVLYELGPTAVRGDAVADANASLVGVNQWIIALELKGGDSGINAWNAIASECYNAAVGCPTRSIGIEIDGVVLSAPQVQVPEFKADEISISGNFTDREAKDLATVLRYGALPIQLEPQQTQTVSATLGKDALNAGIVAGLVGLALVTLYMVAYYRVLGAIAMFSLVISFSLLWAIISWFGANQGLALTLAGITGLIVSIGVSVDSNVVYFENLKEDVRDGRSIRSMVEKSFNSAFSTIVKADVTTLIGAALLYWLSVGPVRGFAFYLGLATFLDLVVSYFMMGPLVMMLGSSPKYSQKGWMFGMPKSFASSQLSAEVK